MLHNIQIRILANLLFSPEAKFQELNTMKCPTDQFNYHIQHLKDLGFIELVDGKYRLTNIGKDFAGRIDTKTHTYVSQPKIGVCLFLITSDKTKILLGKRLKDQSKDLWGPFSEKIRKGETSEETIIRCLQTETGLTPLEWKFVGVWRYSPSDALDVILHCFVVDRFSGTLLSSTSESENQWLPLEETKRLRTFVGLESVVEKILKEEIFFEEIK